MKTVIVTGSTSGIGLGIAENFALSGYNVVLNGLGKQNEIEATRARLAALGAGEVIFHGANMLKPDEIADLVGYNLPVQFYRSQEAPLVNCIAPKMHAPDIQTSYHSRMNKDLEIHEPPDSLDES